MIASRFRMGTEDCIRYRVFDSYSVHKLVYSLFPAKEGRDFLFLDKGMKNGEREILIISNREPESPGFGELSSKSIPEKLFDYESYRFNVKMNPTKRIGGKITPVKDDIERWFAKKAIGWGFDVTSLQILERSVESFSKGGQTITIQMVLFNGTLIVTDRALFRKSFEKGIGREKAFGYGLMQLSPII